MSAAQRNDPRSRPPLSHGVRSGLCFLVFAATVAAVLTWAPRTAKQPARYSASASVIRTGVPDAGPSDQSPTDDGQLKNAVLSDANLRRLAARQGPAAPDAAPADPIESLRRDLDVTVSRSPADDQLEIAVACSGEDPARVVGLVNDLATIVADDYRQQAAVATTGAWQQARQAAADAHQRLLATRAALDDFLAEHFRKQEAMAEKVKASAEEQSRQAKTPEPIPTSRMIVNSEWLELDRTRQELADRREEMLVTRTPQHPMVLELDAKLRRVEKELASVPREVPDEPLPPVVAHPLLDSPPMQPPEDATAEAEPTATLGRVLPAIDMSEYGPTAEKYRQLCDEADEAQETYDRLADAEQVAAERRLEMPEVEVRLAQQCQTARPADGSSRALLIALVAGLALAAGAGMISTGMSTDPPLRTISQAQVGLPAPIVGVLPCEGALRDEEPRSASSRTLAVWGIILVAVCLVSLAVYLT